MASARFFRRWGDMQVRRAMPGDASAISALVNLGVQEGQLLPRSIESIRASIDDWVIAEENGRIVGCGSLLAMTLALGEVRSLAVAPEYRKNGVGAKVVTALVDLARERHLPTVFALTRAVAFFERLGFAVAATENFPEKVWRDCAICPMQ